MPNLIIGVKKRKRWDRYFYDQQPSAIARLCTSMAALPRTPRALSPNFMKSIIANDVTTAVRLQFTTGKPECVHGVVFMGSGNRTGGRLATIDVPALVIRGSRDPFTLEEV